MAIETLGTLGVDSVTVGASSEVPVVCSPSSNVLQISCSAAVNLRVVTGGNGFRIPPDEVVAIDAYDLRGRTFYLHNPGAASVSVSLLYTNRLTP